MKLKARFDPRRGGSYGMVGKYPISNDGTVEVDDTYGEWLLSLNNNAWDRAGAIADTGNTGNDSGMTLTREIEGGGMEIIDLMDLDKPELLAMAIEIELEVSGRNSAQTIREAIMAHVTIEQ